MNLTQNKKTNGSALVLALLTGVVLSMTLGSYLLVISADHRFVFRSLAWNSAIPVAEAGLEEALTQLYQVNGTNNLSANGWTLGADGYYHKIRTLGAAGHYDAAIQAFDPPIILSTGFVPAPLCSSNVSLARKIRLTTAKLKTNGGGLSAKQQILFSGGGSLDSFDSTDPTASTNGIYDPTKRKANGIAQTNLKLSDAIHVDTALIYGTAVTGPGGTVTCNSGAVGDIAWDATHSGVQSGHSRNDANLDFPDNTVPFVSGLPPVSGSMGGTNYTYVLSSGNYLLTSVNISGGKSMLIRGNSVLYVTGDFSTSGSGYVYIAPGASLKLYIGGQGSISGSGVVNANQRAASCSIFGLNTCSTMTYSGSSVFYGTVNAPYAAFTFSGSAGACGAFVANTVTISGGAAVHYDESLAKTGQGYVVLSWNEIPAN